MSEELKMVTNEDILHHIANSMEGWMDYDGALYFGSPVVVGDNLEIIVSAESSDDERSWKLSIREVI